MQKEAPAQLTLSTSRNVAKPVELSLDERSRHISETDAAPQLHRRYVLNLVGAVIAKNLEHFSPAARTGHVSQT